MTPSTRARHGSLHPRWLLIPAGIALLIGVGVWYRARSTALPPASGSDGPLWFKEQAQTSGLVFHHHSGHTGRYFFPEIVAGGVCLIDYDNDDDLDVYFVQGGTLQAGAGPGAGNQLFRNRGNGTFDDVSVSAAAPGAGYGMGCAAGDYDADGYDDLFVTHVGPDVLYRNRGDGSFEDVTDQAGVGHPAWGSSCAFLDYDADGHLDLFVVNYIRWSAGSEIDCFAGDGQADYCSPNNYHAPAPPVLYRNRGDGTFQDVTAQTGSAAEFGNGLGLAAGDFNGDGRLDIYVANDGTANQLWTATADGRLRNDALLAGCAVDGAGVAEGSMGAQAVDVDQDGDLDLFMTNLDRETTTLYLNEGGWFQDATSRLGLAAPSFPFTGFGLGFVDFDHDGALDLYVANGRVKRPADTSALLNVYDELNQVFTGTSTGFREVLPRGGTVPPLPATSRGAAFGDLDGDGGVDVVVVNKDQPAHLLINTAAGRGRWIMFRVLNEAGRDALYAGLELEAGGRVQRRQVQRAYSYCASNDPRVHFGLGPHQRVDAVTVHWPGGGRERFGPFEAGAVHTIRQGTSGR